jgi:hypothetical protein
MPYNYVDLSKAPIPIGYRPVWNPLPGSQYRYLKCPYFECLLEGTRGGGKTDCLLMDFVQHVGKDDRTAAEKAAGMPQRRGFGAAWRGIIVRRTYGELRDLIERSQVWLYQMFDGAAKYNKTEKAWTFPDGEKLTFVYADSPEDYRHYHGWNLTFVGFEELTLYPTDNVYKKFMSLVRSTYPGIPLKYRSTTNPSGPGHGWVKLRFGLPHSTGIVVSEQVEVEYELGKKEMVTIQRTSVRSDVRQNTKLGDPKAYIAGLTANAENPAQLAAWVYGDWNVVAGGMFSDVWDIRCHVLPPLVVPSTWRIDRSYDWGLAKPFSCAWWAESDGSDLRLPSGKVMSTVRGDLFRLREWYGWTGKPNEGLGLMINEQAEGIRKREVDWGWVELARPGPADGQIFNTQGNTGRSFADDFMQPVRIYGRTYAGVPWLAADKSAGSVVQGNVQLRDRMKAVKQSYENGKPRERKGIYICSPCTQWLRTVPSLARDEDDLDRIADGQEDHTYDETRYRVHNPPREAHVGRTRGT